MKKTKKMIGFFMVCMLVFSCSMMSLAAGNVPVLTLEKNEYNSNGERYIKLSWEGTSGTYQLQLDDDENFKSPITKKRTSGQGKYYNFVLSENDDATYYARVRLANGNWSNIIVAEMEEIGESESNAYLQIPNLPSIPNITGSLTFPSFSFSGFNFPVLTK